MKKLKNFDFNLLRIFLIFKFYIKILIFNLKFFKNNKIKVLYKLAYQIIFYQKIYLIIK